MELALATKQVSARSALTVALRQLLFLIALGCGISYVVPACFSFAARQLNDAEPRSSALAQGSGFNLQAELVCESAPPRGFGSSACNLPK
jgi:hypothetical protein